jgi:hypothetical protein
MRYSSDDGSDSGAGSPRAGGAPPPKPPDAAELKAARLRRAGLVPAGDSTRGQRRVGVVLLVHNYGFEVPFLDRARRMIASLARPPFGVRTHEVDLSACPDETERYACDLVPAFYVCAPDGGLFVFQGRPDVEALFGAWQSVQPPPSVLHQKN